MNGNFNLGTRSIMIVVDASNPKDVLTNGLLITIGGAACMKIDGT
jgi:hypothetical protein